MLIGSPLNLNNRRFVDRSVTWSIRWPPVSSSHVQHSPLIFFFFVNRNESDDVDAETRLEGRKRVADKLAPNTRWQAVWQPCCHGHFHTQEERNGPERSPIWRAMTAATDLKRARFATCLKINERQLNLLPRSGCNLMNHLTRWIIKATFWLIFPALVTRFFFVFFFFSGPNWTRHANQTGRPSAFGRCLQQQTEGSIEGEEGKKLLESWCRNSRDAAWHLKGTRTSCFFSFQMKRFFSFFKSRKKWPPRNNQVERGQKGRCAPTVCGLHSISILFLFFLLLPKKRTFQFFCPFSSFFRCSSSRDSRSLLFVHLQHLPAQIKTFVAVGLGGGGESGGGAPPLHRTSGPSAHSTLLEHFSSKKKKMSYYEEHSLSHVYILWRNQHWWKLQRRDNRPSQLAAAASVAIAVIRRFSTFFYFLFHSNQKRKTGDYVPTFQLIESRVS